MRANVYIDGFNLYYGALKTRPECKWLDLEAFARGLLLQGQTLSRVRYFTARVTGVLDPQQPRRQQAYLRALETLPLVSVHEGQFKANKKWMPRAAPPHRTVQVIHTEEKGSDVNLATYLLLDGSKRDCDVAIVVSDDFDLKEPLGLARRELGLTVGVASPRCRTWLQGAVGANFYRPVREPLLRASQLPSTLSDAAGTIHRPATWQ